MSALVEYIDDQKLRKYGNRPSFPIYVWNGLLEPKHRKKIGPALWEFLWCIDRVTREKDGVGFVLGGKPVTYAEMAEDFGVSEKTIQRHMERLCWAGYIEPILTPRGYSLRVLNSRKFVKEVGQKCPTTGNEPRRETRRTEVSTQAGQNCPPRSGHSVHPPDKSVLPNIRESSCSKQLEKTVEKAPAAAKTAPQTASLFSLIRQTAKAKNVPQSPSRRELDKRRRVLLDQAEQIQRKTFPATERKILTQEELDEQKRTVLERYGNGVGASRTEEQVLGEVLQEVGR